MTTVEYRVIGGRLLAAHFSNMSREVAQKVKQETKVHGSLLKTQVQANASGRPGPNAPTGDYRRSWSVQNATHADAFTATVGTNAPQGRRLEYGFFGTDSLGRHYHQPPYEHVGPAVDSIEPRFFGAIERIVNAI